MQWQKLVKLYFFWKRYNWPHYRGLRCRQPREARWRMRQSCCWEGGWRCWRAGRALPPSSSHPPPSLTLPALPQWPSGGRERRGDHCGHSCWRLLHTKLSWTPRQRVKLALYLSSICHHCNCTEQWALFEMMLSRRLPWADWFWVEASCDGVSTFAHILSSCRSNALLYNQLIQVWMYQNNIYFGEKVVLQYSSIFQYIVKMEQPGLLLK